MPNKQRKPIVSNITKVRLSSPIESNSTVNGEGLRLVVWFQGCLHACKGCHNQETWAIDGGYTESLETLKNTIKDNVHRYTDGITFSGGDPLFQIDALIELASYSKNLGLNVWVYSGERFEILMKDKKFQTLAASIDVLVDGRFVLELKDLTLDYRGSSNQRLIDVQTSFLKDETILYKLNTQH